MAARRELCRIIQHSGSTESADSRATLSLIRPRILIASGFGSDAANNDTKSWETFDHSRPQANLDGYVPICVPIMEIIPTQVSGNQECGGKGIRTPGLLIANETLYQLSYTPEEKRKYHDLAICQHRESNRVKYGEIIADKLSKAGWELGLRLSD